MNSDLNESKHENAWCCIDDIPYAPTSTHRSKKYLPSKPP